MAEKYKTHEILVRQAKREDMTAVAEMIQELADFEKMSDGPKLTVEALQYDGFERQPPAFMCKVAEVLSPKAVVGYALYFPSYSTWEGRSMKLEDLYVRQDVRRRGVGQKLFNAVAKETFESGCARLDFQVLEWNPARSFYEMKGAVNLTHTEDWCSYRLSSDKLKELAEGSD